MEQRNWPRSHEELQHGPIKVRVAAVEQFFNPMDPTSIDERSLNPEAADWIEEWAEDLDKDQPISVEIFVADGRLGGREPAIVNALHNHFEYREWQSARQLSKLWREGRISLLIGFTAIASLNAASRLIGTSKNPVIQVLHDGLAVIGWVSMWKPMEIFLYQWWPIRRERRACHRLAEAEVRFPVTTSR
jgi:hypothetical protein